LRATAWVQSIIDTVTPDDLDRPTPCEGWTVSELLEHMAQMARVLTMLAARKSYDELPEAAMPEQVAANPSAGYKAMLDEMTRELDDGHRLKQTVVFGMRLPVGHYLVRHIVGQVGHGWDLAVAIGHDAT